MDTKLVNKVMTFKSGQFVFSRRFDRTALERLFIEARVLKETVAELPVLPWLAAKLDEETIRRAIHSTAAIEGNPLTEEQVGRILAEPSTVRRTDVAGKEIANLRAAYVACRGIPIGDQGFKLTEGQIKKFHQIITRDIEHKHNQPGGYRNHLVKVGDKDHGGIYTPPKLYEDIVELMQRFIAWINSEELLTEELPIRAALAHYHLGTIHPFSDGNGRTARLVEALILQGQGIGHLSVMLSNYYYRNVDDYYWAFSLSEKNKENDVTPFIEFVVKAFIDSLYALRKNMTYAIRRFAMRDYLAYARDTKQITQRQHGLLTLLLDYAYSFSLNELFAAAPYNFIYRFVSERTARRDIEKLLKKGLLVNSEGRYSLNMRALDNYTRPLG